MTPVALSLTLGSYSNIWLVNPGLCDAYPDEADLVFVTCPYDWSRFVDAFYYCMVLITSAYLFANLDFNPAATTSWRLGKYFLSWLVLADWIGSGKKGSLSL